MFYSQTFLARKGPLGTVWCAAHLQHRLKKSHYNSTDISSAIDRIMFPEVPIALRMSGHLLLGVVRIYSKKVEYLFHDCNVMCTALRKVFVTVDVTLPEDARQASFEAITLPERLDLDAVDLQEDTHDERANNQHLTTLDEITIQDQVPTRKAQYVTITFDDDIIMEDAPRQEAASGANIIAQNTEAENAVLQPEAAGGSSQIPGGINEGEVPHTPLPDSTVPPNQERDETARNGMPTPDFPEIMLDAPREIVPENPFTGLPTEGNDINIEKESLGQTEGFLSPQINSRMVSIEQSSIVTRLRSRSRMSVGSLEAPELPTHFSPVDMSPRLAVKQSPPVEHRRVRGRKRNILFDKSTVLSNKYMKISLDRPGNLLRERRQVSSSSLDVWMLNNIIRKQQVFQQSSFIGLSTDISTICVDFIKSKPDLVFHDRASEDHELDSTVSKYSTPLAVGQIANIQESREVLSPQNTPLHEPTAAHSPADGGRAKESHLGHDASTLFPSIPPMEIDMEIEQLRHVEDHPAGSSVIPELFSSSKLASSSIRRDDFTPTTTDNEPRTPKSVITSGTTTSLLDTPFIPSEDEHGFRGSALPDIPETSNVEDSEELYFLDADNKTPAKGSQARSEVDSLSVRTRAVAQYLKRQSPTTPTDASRHLSLNKILEGRTRKLCARMFFETLVMKSYGLLDVHQEESYGDIQLKPTPALSKARF